MNLSLTFSKENVSSVDCYDAAGSQLSSDYIYFIYLLYFLKE